MKKWKKAVSLSLVVAMAMAGITGCSSGGGSASSQTSSEGTSAQNQSSAAQASESAEKETTAKEKTGDKKVTIHFATWIADGQQDSIDNFYRAVSKFNETYPDIEVILDTQPTNKADDFEQKYNLLLLSGDKTDIITNKSMEIYSSRAQKGLFIPIDTYMEQNNTSMDDYRLSTKLEDGMIYGLPAESDANLVLLNKDALDEAGLPVPDGDWTWEDFAEYAAKLTKEEGGKKRYGSIAPFWGDPVMYYLAVAQSKDDNPLFKDAEHHNFDDPVLREWLEFKYRLGNIDKTEVSYTDYTTGSLNYQSEFFNGNAAMLVTGLFSLGSVTNTETFPHDFTTAFAILPRWKESPLGAERDSCGIYGINANIADENKEAAYKFIDFYSKEGLLYMGRVPMYKDVSTDAIVESTQADKPELVDAESLKAYLTNPDRHAHVVTTLPASDAEMKNILKEEADKYMSDGQTLDEAIANMIKRADTVLAQ